MVIRELISSLPIKDSKKLNLYNAFIKPYWYYKSLSDPKNNYKSFLSCFLHQNSYYGHEYWLRCYSSYNAPIFALIEHGIALEDDISLMGWEAEWGVGSVFTFGDYRAAMLKGIFPDHNIVPIGPRLHYADMDKNYYEEIKRKIDPSSKTMVLYPSHSLEKNAYDYSLDTFYKNAMDFAKTNSIKNILVSLHPSDVLHGFAEKYNALDSNIVVVSGGTVLLNFLPRLKAILTIADITYSNKFGSHVGYSLYMGKPHVINTYSDNTGECNFKKIYNKEENKAQLEHEALFNKLFIGADPWIITKEQKDFADFYFGFSHVKSKHEMYNEIEKCRELYKKKFR